MEPYNKEKNFASFSKDGQGETLLSQSPICAVMMVLTNFQQIQKKVMPMVTGCPTRRFFLTNRALSTPWCFLERFQKISWSGRSGAHGKKPTKRRIFGIPSLDKLELEFINLDDFLKGQGFVWWMLHGVVVSVFSVREETAKFNELNSGMMLN